MVVQPTICLILSACISSKGAYIRQGGDLLGMTHNTNRKSYRLCGLGQECRSILVYCTLFRVIYIIICNCNPSG